MKITARQISSMAGEDKWADTDKGLICSTAKDFIQHLSRTDSALLHKTTTLEGWWQVCKNKFVPFYRKYYTEETRYPPSEHFSCLILALLKNTGSDSDKKDIELFLSKHRAIRRKVNAY